MLAKSYRLTKRGSFDYLYRRGTKLGVAAFSLVYLLGKSTKIGFSVSNKIGKAHQRNLVKRRLRAIVRELLPRLVQKAQIVFVAKVGISNLDFAMLRQQVIVALTKSKLIQPK